MVDSKISAAQVAAGETFAGLNDEIAAQKKGKSVEGGTYFPETNLAGASATQDQFYGMRLNSFPGQTPPPSTVHAPSIQSTSQTGAGGQTGLTGQYSSSPAPRTSIPSSAVPSRTGEMMMHTGPHATS